MVHKIQFSEDCAFNDAKARLQTSPAKGKSRTHKWKAAKIFIDGHAENGARRSALCRCRTYHHQWQRRLRYVVVLE